MALRLCIEGNRKKVTDFLDAIQQFPQWQFYRGTKVALGKEELKVEYFFNEKALKPMIKKDRNHKFSITSETGENIHIDLLDTEVVDMGNGIIYIHGKNYDIFAD